MEDFLINFKGCLLIVSHDRYFMDKLVDSLFVFEGDGVISGFTGNYADYRDKQDEKEKKERLASKKNQLIAVPTIEIAPEPIKENSKKAKISFKEKFEFDQLEKEIPELEKEKAALSEKMNDVNINHLDLQAASQRYSEVAQQLDEKSMRWLELSELV